MAGPLLVFDAPYVLFRAFYGLPASIKGADGTPVNALLGSVNAVLAEVDERKPRAVVACFGPDAAPYRVELYPDYHADRGPLPDDLAPQFDAAPGLYEALGWTPILDASVEADDLLHSLALVEREAGGEALILTGDRDLFQCAGDGVSVLLIGGGKKGSTVMDATAVEKRYGIPPALVPDFIALRGDPSDGLPGAPGIGEKKAADLLRRHGSLDGAIEGALGESPSVRVALRDSADQLRAFREIALLRRVEVERPPDRETDFAAGAAAARGLGMRRLAERLQGRAAG